MVWQEVLDLLVGTVMGVAGAEIICSVILEMKFLPLSDR